MSSNLTPSPGQGQQEPPMFLQRPSSAKSQDIQHVLAKTFRQLFARDAIAPDTVQYLKKSRGGDDLYHEKYVEALQKVQEEREKRMSEAAMLERHIMQAQARAMSADERQLNRMHASPQAFPDLGLPPPRAHFQSCIDVDLLRTHKLLVPDDYAVKMPPIAPPPSAPVLPSFARETQTSQRRRRDGRKEDKAESALPPETGSGEEEEYDSEDDDAESLNSLPRVIDSRDAPPPDNRVKNLWKSQLHPDDREQERTDLKNLQERVDYLKNPRHLPPSAEGGARTLIKSQKRKKKEVGIKPKPERAEPHEPSVIFVACPSTVVFTNYSVGQMYEITLELKNVTTVLRPIRVLPPKTSYFSVGLGQFPGEHGLIAPGMSCLYIIRFAPDSLGDYDDELIVQTQSSQEMVVKIQARRPPPLLTLPKVLDVGQCLVGGVKIAQFEVKNEGGSGKFAIMKKEQWPASNFKSITSSGAVTVRPFEVRPSVFETKQGQSMMLEVLFVPQQTQRFSQPLVIVCDNCHVQRLELTGEGQVASVELDSVEDGLSETLPDELCDITAQHLIKFSNLNPYTYVQRMITIRNPINVDLPYSWIIVKPYIRARDPEDSVEIPIPTERIQDVDSAFNIEPNQGTLKASQTTEFTVTFAPPAVNKYHSVLHMVLQGMPKPKPASPASSEDGHTCQPPTPTTGRQRKQSFNDNGEGAMVHVDEPDEEDVTALELEVKGVCEPLSVMLQPYAIQLPGQLMLSTAVKRQFRMVNNSITVVVFQWQNVTTDDLILEVEPPIGELMPQSELDFDLTIVGSRPGRVSYTLLCQVQHLDTPLTLNVDFAIKGPDVVLEQSNLNFGLIRLGETVETRMSIRNTSRVPAIWSVKESPTHCLEGESDFTFDPCEGELRPLECREITFRYRPSQCVSLRTVFLVQVEDGKESAIAVLGEVQRPTACLVSSTLTIDETYLEVITCGYAQLLNQTLLPTSFRWGEAEGKDAALCSVCVVPDEGPLEPREELRVEVQFKALKTGPIEDVRIPCHVDGMERPVYLALKADTKGLSVTYSVLDQAREECCNGEDVEVDYGTVSLGAMSTRYVLLRNDSAITAPYRVNVDYFSARPPSPPQEGRLESSHSLKGAQRRSMLARTPNLADPFSKTPEKQKAEVCKAMLQQGKGASFALKPASGVLAPFSTELIEVTAFCDMYGTYTDNISFQVENLDLVQIPVKMVVVGCPLSFQMCAANPGTEPVLRFGTQVSGVPASKRQMRLNNTSPYDIRLDWQVFNDEQKYDHLLDFIVTYGKQFPEKDESGYEVVPTLPSPTPTPRVPTDLIPNSPDTTTLGLRSKEPTFVTTTESIASGSYWGDFTAAAMEKQPKLISVTLREHNGIQEEDPYAIKPDQMVVPAKGHATLHLSFTPFANERVTGELDCNGYALGYMSLTPEALKIEGKVERQQGYEAVPLKLTMTGQVKPATMCIECADEEGMRFRTAASDLMHNGKLLGEVHKVNSLTLRNTSLTALTFQLLTGAPFNIVQMDKISERPKTAVRETQMTSLNPRQNMLVHVSMRVSADLLDHVSALTDGDEDEQPEGVSLETNGSERKLHFRDELIVRFNNGTTQTVPLHATLTVPSLEFSKTELDFGTCLVGQRRELQFTVNNPTGSASYWVASIEHKSNTCTDTTFEMTPSSGLLEAHVHFVSSSKQLIRLFFTAKHEEDYEAMFVFSGMLGETSRQLRVTARGSYDGKHEAVVNI